MSTAQATDHRQCDSPDETRSFAHGRLELLHVGGSDVGRLVLEPGWRSDEPVVVVDWYGASNYAR